MKKGVFSIIFLIIFSIFFFPKLLDTFNKFTCESSGKKYLEQIYGKSICREEFSDAGKECHLAGECKGICFWVQPTPIYEKTSTSQGFYNPPPKEYKGICSRFNMPSKCIKGIPHPDYPETLSLDNSGKPSNTIHACSISSIK